MQTVSTAAIPWRRRPAHTSCRRPRARDWRAQGYLSPCAAHLRRTMKQRVHRATRRHTRAILRGATQQLQLIQKGHVSWHP